MAGKTSVIGPNAHPFYRWASEQRPREAPRWNFHKYLIGRDGRLLEAWSSRVGPMSKEVTGAVEKALG
jgi:glutathione peroxidase